MKKRLQKFIVPSDVGRLMFDVVAGSGDCKLKRPVYNNSAATKQYYVHGMR